MEKTAGTGTSPIAVDFANQAGTLTVESGSVSLAGGGTDTGGTFDATPGTTIDMAGNDLDLTGSTFNAAVGTTIDLNGGGTGTVSF